MPGTRRTVAVLLAGGVGTRIGSEVPKQLLRLAGVSILERSLAALHDHPDVDEVVVVMAAGHLEAARALVADGDRPKVSAVLEGGATRSESSVRALARVTDDDCRLLVHDAARPLVTPRVVADCVRALDHHDAVMVAVASSDTVVEVDDDGRVVAVPPRSRLRRAQTPQGFRAGTLRSAYALAARDPGFVATDDCSVVLRYRPDVPVVVVPGDERNLKVTEPLDLEVAELLLRLDEPGTSGP